MAKSSTNRSTRPGPAVRLATILLALAAAPPVSAQDASREDLDFFERKVRPLLAARCYECHSRDSKPLQGGLRLDRRDALLRGGDTGPAVAPGRPAESPLLAALRYEDGLEMPPKGKLPAAEIALIEEWIARGAPMPPDPAETDLARAGIDFDAGRTFWSFQPLHDPPPPAVRAQTWPARPLDAFILARLEAEGFSPSPQADRRTLIRRATFDLLGLPPTPEETAAFLADDSPDAYARLIDRLLASPRYGERWGRHWLDLARYSDATASWLDSLAQAWLYRDWVIDALNEDLPYDEFVRRQLAADQIPGSDPKDIAALGFLGLSPVYWKELKLDKEVIKGTVAEEWEERIDAIGRTFLGLTVACARCHDHKYDPIGTADYYALAGVLASTRLIERPVIPEPAYAAVLAAREKVKALGEEIKQLESAQPIPAEAQAKIADLRGRIAEIERTTPRYRNATANAVDDAALYVEADGPDATKLTYKPGEPLDLCVQIRGNPSNAGPVVPRRFLTVLSPGEPKPFTRGSGRIDLADAIVTDAAPLAARVIVNRVWRHHFGRGLVDTPSDFGAQGSPPTHPDLLDHLASRFVSHGWSLKWLHRELLLSAAYRQTSSQASTLNPQPADPDNHLLSRSNRRRLEVEAWRDAMLVAAGSLDPTLGGPALDLKDPANVRRTVYGRVDRNELDDLLRLYDFPDPLAHSPAREPTTTPLQQLLVLNSPLLRERSAALAARVLSERPADPAAQVRRAYELLFQRPPTDSETQAGLRFLATADPSQPPSPDTWRQYAQALLGSNEFLFID